MNNAVDLTSITQPILTVLGTIITGLLVIYVPKALDAFQKWAGVQLTEQQRQTILGSVQTAAGKIETKLDQSLLNVSHVTVDNPIIRQEAQSAIAAVPTAAAALGMTEDSVARMIVGRVDTATHGTVPVTTQPAPISTTQPVHMSAAELAQAIVEAAKDDAAPATISDTKNRSK
jgi:hypothetical protein